LPDNCGGEAGSTRILAFHRTRVGNVSSRLCAGKDERGQYNTGAVEYAYQCAGERYALSMVEATPAQPNMATANVITEVYFFDNSSNTPANGQISWYSGATNLLCSTIS
jgi:hypothetical protein